MSILFCTGTLFSKWQELITTINSSNPSVCHENSDLSSLANNICQQQYPELDELSRKPFDVDSHHLKDAKRLTSEKPDESVLIWSADNICLNLDFWKDAHKETKFLLFFSSPEFDLSNFISEHPFDASQIDKVIAAWAYRTQAMLTFFMNDRDQCLLVNVEAACSKLEEFLQLVTNFAVLDSASTSLDVPPLKKYSAQIEYLATTLLLNNQHVSEIYDEVRSTASLLSDDETSIPNIGERSKKLIIDFLGEVASNKRLADSRPELEDELSLSHVQINQMQQELEYYFRKSTELEKEKTQHDERLITLKSENNELARSTEAMADYLNNDPLLKIAQHVCKAQ